MKVLGLDSAMTHTGWVLLQFDPSSLNPVQSPHPSHPIMHYHSGGTITYKDTSDPRLERLIRNACDVHLVANTHHPDIVVIEGALDKGIDRSPTGSALYALIMSPWHPCRDCYQGSLSEGFFTPPVIVTISPERHMSLAHQKRKLTGTEKVQKYRQVAAESPKGRVSEHMADAYFLAYLGSRFWMTKEGVWPKSILTPHENAIFFDNTTRHPKDNRRIASKSMIDEEGYSWWSAAAKKELSSVASVSTLEKIENKAVRYTIGLKEGGMLFGPDPSLDEMKRMSVDYPGDENIYLFECVEESEAKPLFIWDKTEKVWKEVII